MARRAKDLDATALRQQVSAARAAGTDSYGALVGLTKTISDAFDALGCDVYRNLPEAGCLEAAATWPPAADEQGSWIGVRYPLAEWPSFRAVVESPTPSQIRVDAPDLSERERLDLTAWGIGATMGVRLEVAGRVAGCLVVSRKKVRDFTPDERAALARCAPAVAEALTAMDGVRQ